MMLQFFWTRSASIWIALLYMALGIPMIFFPSLTGSLFVWTLAGGTAAYGIAHLWRYIQGSRNNDASGGDLFLAVLPGAFSIFALIWPQAILSFLPLVLGAFLLIDGVGKTPLVITGIQEKHPARIPLLFSALVPLILGLVLILYPFHAAQIVIMLFGATLMADGLSDLLTALISKKSNDAAPKTPGTSV